MKKTKFTGLSFDNVETLTKEQQVKINGGNSYYDPNAHNFGVSSGGEPAPGPHDDACVGAYRWDQMIYCWFRGRW